MSGCRDKHFADLLWAYELGMLNDEDRRALEVHALECAHCRRELLQFGDESQMIRNDPDIHRVIHQIAALPAEQGIAAGREKPPMIIRLRPALLPLAVAAAVLLVVLLRPWQIEFHPSQDAQALGPHLAVMYFDNLADPQDTLQLGEIAANLLITDLSSSAYLKVVSGQRIYDILKLLGRQGEKSITRETAQAVADTARAELMLLGSILQTEPHLVITSQLIEVHHGEVVASHRITGEPGEEVFALVDRLSAATKNDLSLPPAAGQEPDPPVAQLTTSSPEAYRNFLQGIEELQKFYRSDAARYFTRALELDSTLAMAYYYLAELTDAKLINKAVEHIDRAAPLDRFYIRSRQAVADGNRIAALAELERLLAAYPEEKEAHYRLAGLHSAEGNYDSAAAHYLRALAVDPLYRPAVNNLAYLYDAMGEYEKAIVTIDSYILLAPNEANPYDSRGDIYGRNGRIDLAIESFRKALEIKPDFHNSIWNLGHLHCLRQEYAQAESLYQVLAHDPNPRMRVIGRLYLPYIPLHQGKFNRALQVADESIAADEADGPLTLNTGYKYFLKSRIYSELGDYARAREEFQKQLEIFRTLSPEAAIYETQNYVQLLAEGGDPAEAENVANQLKADLEAGGYDPDPYWYAVGCIALQRGNDKTAVDNFEKIAEVNRRYPEQFMLGRAYLAAGRLPEAVAEFERLTTIYTTMRTFHSIWNVQAHYYLGLAYEQSNWFDKALEQYHTFLDLWKDADAGLPLLDDARARVARLEARS